MQWLNIGLAIFYSIWLGFVAFVLYRLAQAAQRIASAIHRIAEQRDTDDHAP